MPGERLLSLARVREVRATVSALCEHTMAFVIAPVAIVALTLWVHLYQFSAPLQWDSYVLMIIGKYLARGMMPYRDLWEMKPPGTFWYLGGVFSVLPTAVWSVRIVDFFAFVVAGAAFYRLCRVETGRILAIAGTGLWLYFAHHPRFDLGGVYTENYMVICEVVALACAASYRASGRLRAAVLSGLAAAGAILCKHPGGAVVLPALLLIAARPSVRAFGGFCAALVLPLVATVTYYWARGVLPQFLDCNVWFLLPYGNLTQANALGVGGILSARLSESYREGAPYFREFPVLIAALVVGVPVCVYRPTFMRVAALLWLVTDLAGIAMQGHYFQHYFIQMFEGVVLVGILGLGWYIEPRANERWYVRSGRLALAAALAWWTWPMVRAGFAARQPEVSRQWQVLLSGPRAWRQNPGELFEDAVGTYIRERTDPDDSMLMDAWGSTVLGVYWAADRRPASRYFYPNMLTTTERMNEQFAELDRTTPEYIAVLDGPGYAYLKPLLVDRYFLETVKYEGYRIELWGRLHREPLATGRSVGLVDDPGMQGLKLSSAAGEENELARLAEPRRGEWTSPVLPVRGSDGTVYLDWNARSNAARNPSGKGFPRAEATHDQEDVRSLLGVLARTNQWMTGPRDDPQTATVLIGHRVLTDRVIITPGVDTATGAEIGMDIVLQSAGGVPSGGPSEFSTIPLSAVTKEGGRWRFDFPPRLLSALRMVVTPTQPGRGAAVGRLTIPALGVEIKARYRSGPTPDLTALPWIDVDDTSEPAMVRASGFVQVQCELLSYHPGLSPALRYVQIGRLRFED